MASASTRSVKRSHGANSANDAVGDLEAELVRLEGLRLGELRAVWQQRYGTLPPITKSRDVLVRLLAWRLQEDVCGGFKPEILFELRRLARAFARDPAYVPSSVNGLRPGTELIRDWHGKRHVVHVREDGLDYEGKRFKTLSEIARTITSVRWSGPAFFGLRATGKQRHR